jgi:molybdate transport system ATP-binding protein
LSSPKPHRLQPFLSLRDGAFRLGDCVLFAHTSWTFHRQEHWAIIGANGSGKSLLADALRGRLPLAQGELRYHFRPPPGLTHEEAISHVSFEDRNNDVVVFGRQRGSGESVWDIKQHVGWVSPELHLHFNASATCFEVVASGFHDTVGLFQPPPARQRTAARRWLARFQLLEFAHRPLFSLSAGLQRMVLLARAMVKDPRLLILDEPCQALDAVHRKLFVQTMDALIRAESVTAIYVTHRPDEIPSSIKRVFRLRK